MIEQIEAKICGVWGVIVVCGFIVSPGSAFRPFGGVRGVWIGDHCSEFEDLVAYPSFVTLGESNRPNGYGVLISTFCLEILVSGAEIKPQTWIKSKSQN